MDGDAFVGGQAGGQRLHERIRGLLGVGAILFAVWMEFATFSQWHFCDITSFPYQNKIT